MRFRLDFVFSILFAGTVFVFCSAAGISADESSRIEETVNARHLRQFDEWVLGKGTNRKVVKASDFDYRMEIATGDLTPSSPVYGDVVDKLKHLTGVNIIRVEATGAGEDSSLLFVETDDLSADELRHSHLMKFRWMMNSVPSWEGAAESAISSTDKIYKEILDEPRTGDNPCFVYFFRDEEVYGPLAQPRVLAFFAAGLVPDEPGNVQMKDRCFVRALLVRLGIQNSTALQPSDILASDGTHAVLSQDMMCLLETLYDERILRGMQGNSAHKLARTIIPTKDECRGN